MGKDKKDNKAAAGKNQKGGKSGKNEEAEQKPAKMKGASSINVRHILCEKESKLLQAIEKLENGERFDKVAAEFSEDKARQGGLLGWKVKGSLDKQFEEAAYQLEPSTVDKPKWVKVKTQFGWHCIMVEGRK